ncbi:hypothetical protein EST38_g11463 [Candolleomyces aberdarensis]|uniref:Uncharacterized protein n=1 Tax=Candolleomyces aberdarensis TaxID=2316362 RepID=A0A4Q2D5G6_9AGAR|nr:hypothetical protein EST38_g11463 [Candolleomyces aberdarensis]
MNEEGHQQATRAVKNLIEVLSYLTTLATPKQKEEALANVYIVADLLSKKAAIGLYDI